MAMTLPHMSKGDVQLHQCWQSISNQQRSHVIWGDQHCVQRIIAVTAWSVACPHDLRWVVPPDAGSSSLGCKARELRVVERLATPQLPSRIFIKTDVSRSRHITNPQEPIPIPRLGGHHGVIDPEAPSGRHSTQSGSRSPLTFGPCSNTSQATSGFPVQPTPSPRLSAC
jgi:hypothetical protein